MPIRFSTLFYISMFFTLLIEMGPLAGGAVIGATFIVLFFFPGFWVKLCLGALLVFTVALPALVAACIFYAIIYLAYALTGRLEAPVTEGPIGRDGTPIIEGEYTEVK